HNRDLHSFPTRRSSDLGNGYTILDNGKVDVVFNKPEWKKGLEFLHKLYDEGLLAPETFTQDIDQLRRLGENPDVPILGVAPGGTDRKSTRLNSSHVKIS